VLDIEPEIEDAEDARELEEFSSEIRFSGVSFAYEPGRPVLEKVDLRARRGEITAIVGPTGSGKTTLVSLLLRLFDPDEGRIEIDGVDHRTAGEPALRDDHPREHPLLRARGQRCARARGSPRCLLGRVCRRAA
jgi:ABC-type multidrug transport system fused ATPase/permease subunit